MPSTVPCPACGRSLRVPEGFTGGRARCLGCNNKLKIHLYSDGSSEVSVLPGGLVPVAKHLPDPPPLPERPTERVAVPRKPPFLTRTGAVIPCPWCDELNRLERRHFNRKFQCLACAEWFGVVVPYDGAIPFDCPHCAFPAAISRRMAGQKVKCSDCGQSVRVPRRPLMVLKTTRPRTDVEPEAYSPPVAYAAHPVGRRCAFCGRHIRNPLPICYVCQRLFRL